MVHDDSLRINIFIVTTNIITFRILDVINASQNTFIFINEIVCISPPPYYLDWFKKSYPNITLNWYIGPFFLQCMNEIQATKPSRRKWNSPIDTVVTVLKYKKSTIDHVIYIKVFSDGTLYYITVYTYDVLNPTNNKT